jgi:hypothetical protein
MCVIAFPMTSFAISEACSYHSGVNCSVYNQNNGDAICNDGTDSLVNYSAVDECAQQAKTSTMTSLYEFMVQQANSEYQSALARNDANARAYIAQKQQELTNTLSGLASSGTTLQQLQNTDPSEYNLLLQYAGGDPYALQGLYVQAVKNNGQSSTTSGLNDQICSRIFGNFSIFNSSQNECVCQSGYQLNIDQKQCEQIIATPTVNTNAVIETPSTTPAVQQHQTYTVQQFIQMHENPKNKSSQTTSQATTEVSTSTSVTVANSSTHTTSGLGLVWSFIGHLNPFSWFK